MILGPTASGKTQLALALAEQFAGEIVNCDSVQVYQGVNIGSAKTPLAERRGIAHHLVDIAGPTDDFNAGDYSRTARAALAEISRREKLPIVCGGTGLYLRALLCGLSPAPATNRNLRARLNRVANRRPSALPILLRKRDEAAASRIHPNDLQKLIRAVEITYLSDEPVSAVQNRPRDMLRGYRALQFGLAPDRTLLCERLNDRSVNMFRGGLVDETKQLLSAGYQPNSRALQSLGYRQALNVLSGRTTYNEAVAECQTRTRQYAKRQMTWFRADANIRWIPGFGDSEKVQAEAFSLLRRFLLPWRTS